MPANARIRYRFNASSMKKNFFLILQLLLLNIAYGQNQQLKFGNLSTEQGLSRVYVYCILQDQKGFMWFGTSEGLNMYDGNKFTIYQQQPKDSNSLSSGNIKGICEDSKGRLWILANNGVLNVLDKNRSSFKRYVHKAGSRNPLLGYNATHIYIDNKDNLYLGYETGISILNTNTYQFTDYPFVNDMGKDIQLSTIFFDGKDKIWLGCRNDGLKSFDVNTKKLTHYLTDTISHALLNNSILTFFEDRQGKLWIGTEGIGLFSFNIQTKKFTHYKSDPLNPNKPWKHSIFSIREDRKGNLWVGTQNGGLYIWNSNKTRFTYYGYDDKALKSLSDNSVQAMFEDKQGTMWLGTQNGGVCFYNEELNKFRHYKHVSNSNSVSHNIIKGFCESADGKIWISTEGGGLNLFDPVTGNFKAYTHNENDPNSISTNFLLPVYEDKKGNVWIGTYKGGLNLLDKKTGKFSIFKNDQNNEFSLRNDVVLSIFEDKEENLWIGTRMGLSLFDKSTKKFIAYPNNLVKTKVENTVAILEDSKGLFWIADPNGLFLFNKKTHSFSGLPKNYDSIFNAARPRLLFEDRKGTVWVGTDDGLYSFDRNNFSFKKTGIEDGLPHSVINGMLEDAKQNLWILHNRGLSCYNQHTKKFINYDITDGIQSHEFRRNACVKTKTGEMYIGGVNGFNIFHPDSMKFNSYVPEVYITDFQIFNKSVFAGDKGSPLKQSITDTKEITLSYKQSVFSFEFAALNYILPQKNKYAYMLQGFDDAWNYVSNQRKTTYTNLDPGEYTFRVKASNNDGVWNEKDTSIKIIITPPYWQTWWFKLLAAVLVTAGVLLFFNFRMRSMELQKKELERQVKERTERLVILTEEERRARREAEEANKAKSTFLATMSHEIRTPMNGMLGMASMLAETPLSNQQREFTDAIHNCGEGLLMVINDILDFSKIESGKMELDYQEFDLRSCIEEVMDIFAPRIVQAKLELICQIDKEVPEKILGDKLRLRQILLNLLGNAIKFTSKGEVFVGIKAGSFQKHNQVELAFEIRDTGIGIPENKIDRLFQSFSQIDSSTTRKYGGTGLGLVICDKLIKLMGGNIDVKSKEGEGTSFTFTILTTASTSTPTHSLNGAAIYCNGKHILIVDDNATQGRMLQSLLISWKFNAIWVNSATEALNLLKQTKFDLMLTDMYMPEINGIELGNAVHQQYARLPIILLTSMGYELINEDVAFFSSIRKPIKQQLLLKHIIAALHPNEKLPEDRQQTTQKLPEDFSRQYPLHILIAEDNPINQKLIFHILNKLGYEPELAENGIEVLKAVTEKEFDVILMDVQMPEMDGLEATRKIRGLSIIQPIVIALTANALPSDQDECRQAGMDDYLSKPVKLEELVGMLKKWAVRKMVEKIV